MPLKLSIIIVSYNTKKLTLQAVESILGLPNTEIIVVDNHSQDGSVAALREEFGKRITIIERKNNAGFAMANNEGIQRAVGKYILLLNSDTVAGFGSIEKMVDALDKNPKFGILSCRLLNKDGSYQPQGGALPTLANIAAWWLWPLPGNMPFIKPYQNTKGIHSTAWSTRHAQDDKKEISISIVERGWVGGTAMLIRRTVIDEIGELDEKIFMYAEDIDYCIRAHHKGWRIGIVTRAQITHLGSASGDPTKAKLGEIRGLLYLFSKYQRRFQTMLLRLVILKGALLRYLLFGILKGDTQGKHLYGQIIRLVFVE